MTSLSALGIASLVAGLIIGTVALVITLVVIIRSKKYLVPVLVYIICLLISLVLIGVFVFEWVSEPTETSQVVTNQVVSDQNVIEDIKANSNKANVNIKTNTNTSIKVNTNTVITEPIEVGPTEEDIDYLRTQGQLYNEDYSFVIDVGTAREPYMTEVAIVPFDGVLDTYVYCHKTIDADYASSDCPGTAVEAFRINVYTNAQWEAVQDSPFVGTELDATAGYVYEFAHPNGLFPDDVTIDDEFYNTVIVSFHFAG